MLLRPATIAGVLVLSIVFFFSVAQATMLLLLLLLLQQSNLGIGEHAVPHKNHLDLHPLP